MPTASEDLAAFAAGLRYEAIPVDVIATVKRHILDLLGVALAASNMDFGRAVTQVGHAMGGPATCTIVGQSTRLPAVWAALVNGTFAHGLDYDDTHSESVVHVSTSVVPAALAACEEAGTNGRTLLTAVALGMEANIRIGLVAPGHFHDRGFHPTGVCGAYACALLAGWVRGLTAAQLADALGIAGSQAAGSLEFLTEGSTVKRLHGGWAAHAGLVAARLAAAGFSGPRGTFDGRFGLYRIHLGDTGWDLSPLTAGLGTRWELLQTALKPYPCCHFNHAFIDAVAVLRTQDDLRPEDVERIECGITAHAVPVVCEPLASKRTPQNDYDAKFSLPYAVASMLVRGHVDIDDFTPAAIRDPAVLAVAQRVSYGDDPDSEYPRHYSGRVRVHLRDGRCLEQREPINRGSAARPLTAAEVHDKFQRNATRALSAESADAVAACVDSLEAETTLDLLAAALTPTPTRPHALT